MNEITGNKKETDRLFIILFGLLTLYLAITALFSLGWRMVHDAPLMTYTSFLMERFDWVPYKDIFDFNLPGTYFIHWLGGRFLGYSDLAFRCFDLIYLCLLLTCLWFLMKKFHWKSGWSSVVLFGLFYLGLGPKVSFQREYLALLPVLAALTAAVYFPRMKHFPRLVSVGFFFGLAASIKPHMGLGLAVVVLYCFFCAEEGRGKKFSFSLLLGLARMSLYALVGFLIPLAAMLVYLLHHGALEHFLDIALNYWPLYGSLSGAHKTISSGARLKYLAEGFLAMGGLQVLLVPAAAGVFIWRSKGRSGSSGGDRHGARMSWMLLGMAICFGIYPLVAGKFWTYHWLPLALVLLMLGSLCFSRRGIHIFIKKSNKQVNIGWIFLVLVLAAAFMAGRLPREFILQVSGRPLPPPKAGRVDEIADYLKQNSKPDDKVQPLDWTGGAVHALLIAQRPIATPFIYDFYFYHHLSNQYIRALRKRFIEQLRAAPPEYIIRIMTRKPWPSGPDTGRRFKKLSVFLKKRYTAAFKGKGYTIYRLRKRG